MTNSEFGLGVKYEVGENNVVVEARDWNLAELVNVEQRGMVEHRKSLQAIHNSISSRVGGDGSDEAPFVHEDEENMYIGIFGMVESINKNNPVYIVAKGIKVMVDQGRFKYVSGNSTNPMMTSTFIIESLASPAKYFLGLAIESRNQQG